MSTKRGGTAPVPPLCRQNQAGAPPPSRGVRVALVERDGVRLAEVDLI